MYCFTESWLVKGTICSSIERSSPALLQLLASYPDGVHEGTNLEKFITATFRFV
jgi:hypothetical protein